MPDLRERFIEHRPQTHRVVIADRQQGLAPSGRTGTVNLGDFATDDA